MFKAHGTRDFLAATPSGCVAMFPMSGADFRVRNHDEKIKDMGRSVLPSTGRKGARSKRRTIHKRQRARELTAVTAYRRETGSDGARPDIRGTRGPDITQMVCRRRAADKVGPLIRWAEATIAATPALLAASRREQVAYFAGLMPDSTIGRHAVQHIEQALEWRARREEWNARRRATAGPSPLVAETERQARVILDAGLHGALNAELRKLAASQAPQPRVVPMPYRPLLGRHDIEAFAVAMSRWPAARGVIATIAAAA